MHDPIADFFVRLAGRNAAPLLGDVTTTVRFDLTDAGPVRHWRMTIDHGLIEVSDDGADADCVVSAERPVFEDLVTGRHNVMAALLRGQLIASGDPDVLVRVERLFSAHQEPAPPQTPADPEMAAAGGSR